MIYVPLPFKQQFHMKLPDIADYDRTRGIVPSAANPTAPVFADNPRLTQS
jgi:hypothetical protein